MNQLLLIIDAQQELIDGNQELIDGNQEVNSVFNKDRLIRNINVVIEKATDSNIPVVFVRDLDVADGKGKGFQIHESIHLPLKAYTFNKAATNPFHGTGLLPYLQSKDINHLVIMGCETQHCIDSAVRTATINGFDVTLVGDGHSTSGNNVLSPEQIIQHHNTTLHGHYNVEHFSIVRNASEDLFPPTHDSYR